MNILKKKTYSKYVLAVGLCIAVLLFLPGFFRSRTFAFDALYDSDLNEHSVIWSDTSEEYLYPVEHPEIHCGFNGYSGHNGIDISDKYYDDAVYSVAPGIVQSVGYHESTGYFVIIKHRNIISCYACLGEVFVKEGNIVSVDAIGTVDRSIHTKGHVHLVLYDLEGNYIKNAEELLHQR